MKNIFQICVCFMAACLCGCAGAGFKADKAAIAWERSNPLFTVEDSGSENQAAAGGASSVYVSYDASAKGMKKIYDKILAQTKGQTDVHLYGPDSFLKYADNSILLFGGDEAVRAEKILPPDLDPQFTQVLEQNERFGQDLTQYGQERRKDSPVAKTHKFRFADCMCYLQVEEQGQRCAKMPWFASERCRMFMSAYAAYQKQLFASPVLVVLSRFAENERGGYDGAVKNMLGGNTPISSLNSLSNLWARRMVKPADQHTWFVNVVYAPGGAAKAIVASENMRAAEIESLRIFKDIGEREAFVTFQALEEEEGMENLEKTNPGLYEWSRDIHLMSVLGKKYMPEEFYALFVQQGYDESYWPYHFGPDMLALLEERFSPYYQVKEIK